MSLKITVNGTEGDIATKLVGPPTPLDPPRGIETSTESPNTIRISWSAPTDDVPIIYYIVRYTRLGGPTNSGSAIMKATR
jgi:hypothetical protein